MTAPEDDSPWCCPDALGPKTKRMPPSPIKNVVEKRKLMPMPRSLPLFTAAVAALPVVAATT